MNSFRHVLTVVSYEKQSLIFALGGWFDGNTCSNENECYDVKNDCWKICAPMHIARRLLGAAILNDKIYTFGGNVDDGVW